MLLHADGAAARPVAKFAISIYMIQIHGYRSVVAMAW